VIKSKRVRKARCGLAPRQCVDGQSVTQGGSGCESEAASKQMTARLLGTWKERA
jgi:hypothetical protein